jgi:hypothetical protein
VEPEAEFDAFAGGYPVPPPIGSTSAAPAASTVRSEDNRG